MGRRSRIHYPGALYHAMDRGLDKRDIFRDAQDYERFLNSLNRIKKETNATIYAYCLMPNHFHLAIKVDAVPLGAIMQRILTSHGLTFNGRYERAGHLFEARFKSIPCVDDNYFLRLIHYIQMNPVRAGLVANASDWPWSSRSPVALPNMDIEGFDPWMKRADQSEAILLRPAPRIEVTLDALSVDVFAATGISLGAMRSGSKSKPIVMARARLAMLGVRQGFRLSAVAEWLSIPAQSISYYLRKNSTNC